jgi:hypothetical protein
MCGLVCRDRLAHYQWQVVKLNAGAVVREHVVYIGLTGTNSAGVAMASSNDID